MSTTTDARRRVAGLLGTKLGMTQVWDEAGRLVPVTVIQAGPCVVTQVRTPETDGYDGVQIAFGAIDPRKVTKPLAGHFAKAGTTPRRWCGICLPRGAATNAQSEMLPCRKYGRMAKKRGSNRSWSLMIGPKPNRK